MFFVNALNILIIFILSKYSNQHIYQCFYVDNRIYWFIIYRTVLIRLQRMQNSLLLHQQLSTVWNQQLKLLLLFFVFLIVGDTHTAIPKTLKQSLSLSTKKWGIMIITGCLNLEYNYSSEQQSTISGICSKLHKSIKQQGSKRIMSHILWHRGQASKMINPIVLLLLLKAPIYSPAYGISLCACCISIMV